jgi:hypothetical protein
MTDDLSIIQTLHFNTENRDPINNSVRFLSPEFHWMSWALSCLQLKKLYGHVELYTNDCGAEVLIDRLKLPYDQVDLRLNNVKIDSGLGVLPKVYTYSYQEKPFLHFDGDVIMWQKLDDQLLDRPLITQNPETADHFYRSFYKKLLEYGTWFPDCIMDELNSDHLIRVFNLGIVGGSDIDFFKEFCRAAFEIIDKNQSLHHLITNTNYNLAYEQHLFYCLAKLADLHVDCYITEEVLDLNFAGYADFSNAPHPNKFIHLLGDYKKEEHTCLKLARRLRNDYPEYYYRIINECKKAGLKFYLTFHQETAIGQRIQLCGKTAAGPDWPALYHKEVTQFRLMNERFADPAKLSGTAFISRIEAGTNDGISDDNLLIQTPVSLLMEYQELKLDTLDQILVNLLTTALSFQEILDQAVPFFDENEIKNQYTLFARLIANRLKSGLEDNIFEIISDQVNESGPLSGSGRIMQDDHK